jgi:SNF2 family DNA or RNA helicase
MELYQHQRDALNQTESKNRVAYYHDMGLGKTFTGSEKMMRLGARINLVICQKSKINDWADHFAEQYGLVAYDLTQASNFRCFMNDLAIDASLSKEELIYYGRDHALVAVINYELAWRRPELAKLRDFTLMLDESSLIQNKTAKQTKFIVNQLQPKNVILLSGTPCSGKYENLWTQAKLLGWDISEQTYLSQYVDRELAQTYVQGRIRRFWKVLGYKNVERLKQKLRDHGSVFLKTEEVMNLPEQTFIDVLVDAPKEYKKFIKDGIIQIGDVELVGDTQLTKRLRARQICSLHIKARYEAFEDLLVSTNDRLIVFYNFTAECEELIKIAESLNRPWSVVNGAGKNLSAYEKYEDSITFVQYQAGSKGLNLQKANKIIYFSLTEKCDDWMQSQKRIHRIGQDRPCFYYIIKCKGTVEERIHEALKRGTDYTDELFREEEAKYSS